MINRYIIVDDFYGNPDELVRIALKSIREAELPRGTYAGVMTTDAYLGDQHLDIFKKLTLEPSINPSTNACGKLRFTIASDPFKFHIHYDVDMETKWAGVVYLSKDHPKTEGTSFWKHKRTGLEVAPNTVEGFAKYGWSSFKDMRSFLETEGLDESLWEKTLTVPYKYNRLVLFRPWLLHSPGPAFGDSLESSRIVQTLFLGG
ncbi:MAG: hypothetical protein COA96_14615 [SAR86 cluster bacterium]|uniref:Uncharacterized protein n=1 Tax=SAR86 cluster bacterium TaxID=2030880 RepID=A0A2A5AT12_9GAMM|nr:MAG: hypothetical protein COA96_14615 [SAR86 cluster bacterium]